MSSYITNKFGTAEMFDITDLENKKIYIACAACMSVMSDLASFISLNETQFVNEPSDADVIIVLGCQVTDLAILNDMRTIEGLQQTFPYKEFYMGGCLAYRFDIKLPDKVKRIKVIRKENTSLTEKALQLTHWQKPFWVKDLNYEDDCSLGMLFRNHYPLKIGAGCHGHCKYCTITQTRGEGYAISPKKQVDEFISHDNVVLVSDSPTVSQIKEWCAIAVQLKKPISIRNIEPTVLAECKDNILAVSSSGLLPILHCPIQSNDANILQAMHRNVKATFEAVEIIQQCRKRNTFAATNIIIDYKINNVLYANCDYDWLDANFDYWSWNPYFDGMWDRQLAEKRFEKYLGFVSSV